jgi:hypothetical protein
VIAIEVDVESIGNVVLLLEVFHLGLKTVGQLQEKSWGGVVKPPRMKL